MLQYFLFWNHWLEYNDCLIAVRNALHFFTHSSAMHVFTHILCRVQSNMFAWKSIGVCNLDKDIRATEVSTKALEFENIDNPLDDTVNVNLNMLYSKHRA